MDEILATERRYPLDYKPNPVISVTDLSAQLWCEAQLLLVLQTGYKRETKAMRDGTARHELLEKADHEVVDVEVTTDEDSLAFRLLSTIIALTKLLPNKNKVREVWICYPTEFGITLRGVMDELELQNNSTVIKDTKTRRDETEPSAAQKRTSAMQLHTYHWMLKQIKEQTIPDNIFIERLSETFRVDPMKSFAHELLEPYDNLKTLIPLYLHAIRSIPNLASYTEVEYDANSRIFKTDRVPYTHSATQYAIDNLLEWWIGERSDEKLLKSDKWKCKYCDLVHLCKMTPLTIEEKEEILATQELQLTDIEDIGI